MNRPSIRRWLYPPSGGSCHGSAESRDLPGTLALHYGTKVPAHRAVLAYTMECMAVDKSGLEVLTDGACFSLLETAPIGRVVYSDRALPVIVPVNFTLDGADVVLRTGRRSRLATHAAGHVIAFEVDDIDAVSRSGWSVVLTGYLQPVDDPADVERLERLGLRSWAPSAHDRYLRLRPDLVTGRRIPAAGSGTIDGVDADDVNEAEFARAD